MSIVEEAQKIIDQDLKNYKIHRVTELLRSIADKKRLLKENTKKTEDYISKIEEEIEQVEKMKDIPQSGSVAYFSGYDMGMCSPINQISNVYRTA